MPKGEQKGDRESKKPKEEDQDHRCGAKPEDRGMATDVRLRQEEIASIRCAVGLVPSDGTRACGTSRRRYTTGSWNRLAYGFFGRDCL